MLMKIFSRSTVLAAIVALALASISATSVFAAGQAKRNQAISSADHNLVSDWKAELAALRAARFTYADIAKWDREWMESKPTSSNIHDELRFASKAAVDLRQAEFLAGKHPGFSDTGKVINRPQANQTLSKLMLDLHNFRVEVKDKIQALFS